jgi:hypothetical protein
MCSRKLCVVPGAGACSKAEWLQQGAVGRDGEVPSDPGFETVPATGIRSIRT